MSLESVSSTLRHPATKMTDSCLLPDLINPNEKIDRKALPGESFARSQDAGANAQLGCFVMSHLINHQTVGQWRVAVRVSPDFELNSSGMTMGGGSKRFGGDAEQVPQLLNGVAHSGLAFGGFHLFAGSQNLRPESIVEAQCKSDELALRLTPCRDTLASPKIAFRTLGVSFSAYLPHRITNAGRVPPLADLMRQRAA